jgi:hypothetical protein
MVDFEKLKGDRLEYFHALGRFVDRFAQTEVDLKRHLGMVAGVDVDTGWVLFSHFQIRASIETLRSLLEKRTLTDAAKGHMKFGLEQLKRIAELRNKLLHSGTIFVSNREGYAMQRPSPRPREELRKFELSAEKLEHLYWDLQKVERHITEAIAGGAVPQMQFGEPDTSDIERDWLYQFADAPKNIKDLKGSE